MGDIIEGRYIPEQEKDVVLDRMVESATNYFGEDLSEDGLAAIRLFYEPIAIECLRLQEEIGLVLDSSQIDHAEGQALDYLCSLINVPRNEPEPATGEVVFSRSSPASTDYVIPSGTVVQTFSNNPVRFQTTESGVIKQNETSVTVPIKAVDAGIEGNVAANTITSFSSKPPGIESVNNPSPTDGGTVRESDDELRERAKKQVADGAGASAPALLTSINQISEKIRSVSIKINDTSTDNSGNGGLPDHSFELVVECPSELYQDVADKIMEKKAAGDNSHGGVYGTEITKDVLLPNGQYHPVSFSTPDKVQIYIDADIEVKDTYPGDGSLINNIVDYIGGTTFEGEPAAGDLRAGEEVVEGEVEYAIRDTKGVYDVTNLEIGTSSNPTSSSNISISQTDIAVLEGNVSEYVTLTKTDV